MEEDIIMEAPMRNSAASSASVLVTLLFSTQCVSLAWNPSTSNLKVNDSTSNYDVADVLNAEGRFYLDANGGWTTGSSPSSSMEISQLTDKSYLIPLINGMINDVLVYPSNANGFQLYNGNISFVITWNGTQAIDYLTSYNVLNWVWHIQRRSGPNWITIDPLIMTIASSENSNGCSVTRIGTLSDNSNFTITYILPNSGALKYELIYTPVMQQHYRLWFELNGLQTGNDNSSFVDYYKLNDKRVHFVLPEYVGLTFDFDYNDIFGTLTQSETFDTAKCKYDYYIELGQLKAGTTYTYDPTTVSTSTSNYATAVGNSRKLFRDAYGKYIAVHKGANVFLDYCNNDPPTSGWSSNNLGSSFVVDAGVQFGVAAAYDSTNDRLMIAFTSSNNFKAVRITFTRDGSGNINGYSAGSILSITPTYVVAHAPSLWMLHNGEVAAVWGSDKISGAKHSKVEFCRLVFGSPPTYKNAAGTSSTTDMLSSDVTASFIIRYPTIVERTNSGTGQYDMWAISYYYSATPSHICCKTKFTWASPNWNVGSETQYIDYIKDCPSTNYDPTNGLIVYSSVTGVADTAIYCRTISASDTDADISKTGLSSSIRNYLSLAINNGDYYFFYYNFVTYQNIYYIRRMAGTWDSSETCFTTGGGSVWHHYASCKVDGVGNRIELLWTYYTVSTTYVYYDYLTLQQPAINFAFVDSGSVAIGTGETTIASIDTPFTSGNNFVLAVVQFQSTAGTMILHGNLRLTRGGTTLMSNHFDLKLASSAPDSQKWYALMDLDTNAGSNPSYDVRAKANATGISGEVKILVINGASGSKAESAANVTITDSETTLATLSTSLPAGDNIVFAICETAHQGNIPRHLTDESLKRGSILAGAEFQLYHGHKNSTAYMQDNLVPYLDVGAPANPQYTATATVSGGTSNKTQGWAKIVAFSRGGCDAYYTDSGSKLIPNPAEDTIATLSTFFPSGSDAVVIASWQVDNAAEATNSIFSGELKLQQDDNSGTQTVNEYALQYPMHLSGDANNDDGKCFALLNEFNPTTSNPTYTVKARAGQTPGSIWGEAKILALCKPLKVPEFPLGPALVLAICLLILFVTGRWKVRNN